MSEKLFPPERRIPAWPAGWLPAGSQSLREDPKGAFVKGGLLIRHLFDCQVENGPDVLQLHKEKT